jgi:RNA polymerase sigma-70 factor (ECF subfamily)
MENALKSDKNDSTEKEIIGKQKMFDQLYDQHKSDVYHFAFYLTKNRGEAEDLFQDTWLRVAKNIPKTLNMKKVKSWIFTITSNLYKDSLRKERVRKSFFLKKRRQLEMNHSSPQNSFLTENTLHPDSSEQSDMGSAISQALAKLPDHQRQIFVLKEMAGFKHSEISKILNLPEGTVKSVLFRAVKRLRKDLEVYYQG